MIEAKIRTETDIHIRTVELDVSGAPEFKADFVYYQPTGLRVTYTDGTVTALTVIATAEDTGESEEITVRLDLYDMWEPWERDLVEQHRPVKQTS